ncbi:hypothetical protein BBM62_03745 [Vibrio parahaemolyticus]|uniref:hypothetical protein n=1 Tax=Vibrio parahaemolyticus TaxID=670 RepID=UPI00084B4F55|nr:hypothetical protein [Vibrio parahaemolyticus]EJD0684303.1 hypothetical protein [Vibrio parahaemolyticus]EJI6216717.1 hypothetical protein [Vibrio parahaemolyticus]OEA48284.1 hypothetical protein BBM62_03745 [Vibrio parahaemolyticus]
MRFVLLGDFLIMELNFKEKIGMLGGIALLLLISNLFYPKDTKDTPMTSPECAEVKRDLKRAVDDYHWEGKKAGTLGECYTLLTKKMI